MSPGLFTVTIRGYMLHLTKEECANLRQQLWDNYSWPLMVELMGNTQVVVSTVGPKKYYQFVSPKPAPEPFPGAHSTWNISRHATAPGLTYKSTPDLAQAKRDLAAIETVCRDAKAHAESEPPLVIGNFIMAASENAAAELPNPQDVDVATAKSRLREATDQPMPDHLDPAERDEIDRLLLTIFRQDVDAIRFLSSHNSGLRAKPLDLIQRDRDGVARVLAYLRSAAGAHVPRPSS